ARRYLNDPILGNRLRQLVRLMTNHKGKSALEILGSPDDLKFRSCLTLFCQAASDDSDRVLFTEALDQFYRGKPDHRTFELLSLNGEGRYSTRRESPAERPFGSSMPSSLAYISRGKATSNFSARSLTMPS